jgi:glutamate synthase (NADPH/NADH) large chain
VVINRISQDSLYEPFYEHDACGVGFVVNLQGPPTHKIVRQGIQVLEKLVHRGACGCDPETGDGAGILVQIPHRFFQAEAERLKFDLPEAGAYGVGMVFLPRDEADRQTCIALVEKGVRDEGQTVLGWRDVPRDSTAIGEIARQGEPVIRQVFIKREGALDVDAFERKLFVIRKVIENAVAASDVRAKDQFYIPSFSARTVVYKGLMLAQQMSRYYRDLSEEAFESRLALVHQRYSTNTFPTWPLAHPFRMLAHNGEINTLRGNINMMRSREVHFSSPLFGDDIKKLPPILMAGGSDSAMLDNALELLSLGGRSLAHSMMMLVPEPWAGHETMSDHKKAFYEFHACMMEPWDGPASVAFTNGVQIGAVLDRNGLRPSRYWVTDDGFVVMASEVGVLDIPQDKVVKKGRLEPGRMFLIDTEEGRIVDDRELKEKMAHAKPYRAWLETHLTRLPEKVPAAAPPSEPAPLLERQIAFGYTQEDLEIILAPMARTGKEPVGSMGNDAPLAVLSSRPQLLFNYFKQLFAQVTNPPIDSIREELVMSLVTTIGREGNLLEETAESCQQLELKTPILTNDQLEYIKKLERPGIKSAVISTLFPAAGGPAAMDEAVNRICAEASQAIERGATILILSDRGVSEEKAAIPCLLATGAVHQYLVREQLRTACGLVVESGEPREVMHFCLLTGYGAGAVNPYLAFETIESLVQKELVIEEEPGEAVRNYIHAIEKGLLKVMSKIGISTHHSYRSAQIFEAVGLSLGRRRPLLHRHRVPGRGIGIAEVAEETLMRHAVAFPSHHARKPELDPGGQYRWRKRGEYHLFNPDTVSARGGRAGRDREALLHRRHVLRLISAPRRTRRSPSP